jgi:hypothetical protein
MLCAHGWFSVLPCCAGLASTQYGESRRTILHDFSAFTTNHKIRWNQLITGIETNIYQLALWHKKFAEMLNVVVMVKTHVQTHKTAHVVLFSSDVMLGYAQLIDYYRLRFQLEFNFR